MRSALATATGAGIGLGLEGGIVGFLEYDILDERLDDDVLLNDLVVLVFGLTDDHTLTLRLEEYPAGGDVLSTAVILVVDTDAGESYLEDADAVETHLLTQLEEVLHGTAELVEDGLDVGFLDRCLGLDEISELLGLDEVLVVDRRCEPLAEGSAVVVGVLEFFELLTHVLN